MTNNPKRVKRVPCCGIKTCRERVVKIKPKRVVLGEGYCIPHEAFSSIILTDQQPKTGEIKDIVILNLTNIRGKRVRLIAEIINDK